MRPLEHTVLESVTTKQKGDIAEAHVLAALLKVGLAVLVPFGDRSRYDLVIDRGANFERVQVKTGRIERSKNIEFNSCSVTTVKGKVAYNNYRGQADTFAVYVPASGKMYMVPVHACRERQTRLSLTGKSRNQFATISAFDYEFKPC